MTAHKHAALMLQYAQDAAESVTPWEMWEYKLHGEPWFPCENHPTWSENIRYRRKPQLIELSKNPSWFEDRKYRRKPQVIRVGRHEFPKPISKAPLSGITYYLIKTGNRCFEVDTCAWVNDRLDNMQLESGRIHLTYEAAQTHANVLNAICHGDVD